MKVLSARYLKVQVIQKFCALNFQIFAISGPWIRFFLFGYRFEALTEWSLIVEVSRSESL